ncbi:hypothetical protein Fcan01_22832 [Folsomia candida]|uniref:Uncharacterized protein n=1 Tax=Folsomia candida TaxID=158441 RepID=A0A226DAQ4_FOLCA|nr:hypothetical protein Fcan01_22832 [Folsomia candida]
MLSRPLHRLVLLLNVAICLEILPSSEATNTWPDIFLNTEITFIFASKHHKLIDMETDFPYFDLITAKNLYTPIRLLLFRYIHPKLHFPPSLASPFAFGYRKTEKSARIKTLIAPLDWTMKHHQDEELKCASFYYFASRIYRQDVIFGRIDLHSDLSCFTSSPVHILVGTAILLLFNITPTSPLFLPCLTCDPLTFSILEGTTISFPKIQLAWQAANEDMHMYQVRYFFLDKVSVNPICDLNHRGYLNPNDLGYCIVSIMLQKYNLTLQLLQLK